MATINLAPGTQFIIVARRRRRILFITAGVICVVLVAIWAGLFALTSAEAKKNQALQEQLTSVQTEIAGIGSDSTRVALFESRLKAIDTLLSNRVSMVAVMKELERLLPTTMMVTKATISLDGNSLSLTGSTPALDDVAQAIASLGNNPERSKIFKHASVANMTQKITKNADGSSQTGVYEFSLNIDLDTSSLQGAVQ